MVAVAAEKSSQIESRVLHHDLLVRLEDYIFDKKLCLDIDEEAIIPCPDVEFIHSKLLHASCIRVRGWAVIEDYERINNLMKEYNSLIEFISRCGMQAIEQSEEYQSIQNNLEKAKELARSEKDKQKRLKAIKQVNNIDKQLKEIVEQATGIKDLPEWLVKGMHQFTGIFMPGRIILRVYPFTSFPAFQVLSNLKKECFVDADFDNFIFSYGTSPTVKLSILGIVSSLPTKEAVKFDPMKEFSQEQDQHFSDQVSFESGFRKIFPAYEELQKFARYSRYPNVTVYPLAVYRTMTSVTSLIKLGGCNVPSTLTNRDVRQQGVHCVHKGELGDGKMVRKTHPTAFPTDKGDPAGRPHKGLGEGV